MMRRASDAGRPAGTVAPATGPPRRSRGAHFHGTDVHGLSHLALTVVEEVIGLIEALHARVACGRRAAEGPAMVSGFPYRQARASTAVLRRWCDALLAQSVAAPADRLSCAQREAVLAVLNGLIGDYLERNRNPLAIRMQLRHDGEPLELRHDALQAAFPQAGGKLLLLVHGLCRNDLQWRRNHHDHGAALAQDLGYTPLYLFYNSGLHISENGRELGHLLETLLREWPAPVTQIVILAHSMGGLVARSACHYAALSGQMWLRRLRKIVFLGTPHHGAPLERGGNWLVAALGRSPYTAPFSRMGRIRSAGITDLRYGNLVDEDWAGRDRFAHAGDVRQPVPLPAGVACYAIAGSTGRRAGDLRGRLLGDGLIPLDTALGRHPDPARTLRFPPARQWIAYGIHHLDLLGRVEVYRKIREWLEPRQRGTERNAA